MKKNYEVVDNLEKLLDKIDSTLIVVDNDK